VPNDPSQAYPVDLDRVLELRTVRDTGSRALVLAAVRELGRDVPPWTAERLARLMRIEELFQTLLVYDQIEFLRAPAALPDAERDFALTVQRICLEAANGFQRFLRHREDWATPENAGLLHRVTARFKSVVDRCFFMSGPSRPI